MQGSSLVVADVFQVFIDRPENGDYLELHVTPDNQSRAIAWTPDRFVQFGNGNLSIDEILADKNAQLETQTWVTEAKNGWQAYLRVPALMIRPKTTGFQKGMPLRGTFCRFDASPNSVAPVLSSTSLFRDGPKFHESTAWHDLILEES